MINIVTWQMYLIHTGTISSLRKENVNFFDSNMKNNFSLHDLYRFIYFLYVFYIIVIDFPNINDFLDCQSRLLKQPQNKIQ